MRRFFFQFSFLPCLVSSRSLLGFDERAVGVLEHLLQLPGLEGLDHDVGASGEFSVYVKLRDRRPIRELLVT